MKILYVGGEALPFASTGGLGDVLGSLPAALKAYSPEDDVRMVMPLHGKITPAWREKMTKVAEFTVQLAWRCQYCGVWALEKDGVTVYFIDNEYYFKRSRLYGEYDDGERYAYFSMAVMEMLEKIGFVPDILHANDWQSALTVIYSKVKYPQYNIKTVYTIHNIEYQGQYDPYILGDIFGIHSKFKCILEYNGCMNLMKGAIVTSDFVTTVSPNYANELTHDFFAFGLSEIIKDAKHKMVGVINGIDYGYFSPETGGDIYESYTAKNYKSGKAKNKAALQAELGLPVKKNVPLIVMITRFTAGKGIDLVLHIIEELLQEDVQVAVLGTGDKEYEAAFAALGAKYENMVALIKFDRVISKKMYAGADIFVMPSKSEPCGLAQMIACSYGTVPVVRSVGGLYDSIRTVGEEGANGFRFDNYNAHELLYTIKSALDLYKNKTEWNKLTASAKNSDFTWSNSAAKYIEIYKNL